MKRFFTCTTAALMLASLALAGVKTDYDRSARFERYQTFAWKPGPANGIVDNALVADRIRGAVNLQLMHKGMRQDNGNPDVYLVYHVNAKPRQEIQSFPYYGYYGLGRRRWGWGGWGGDVYVNRYIQGAVVIDMVDARTDHLVWRAYCTDSGNHLSDVQSAKNIDKMLASAFKKFPPKDA